MNGLLTQQKMLRAAVALFLESGYEKTTTAKIAKAAGMTQSSFFRAFASKEALLLELVRHKNVALSRASLYEIVWQEEYTGETRTLDSHIRRLRAKTALPIRQIVSEIIVQAENLIDIEDANEEREED